MGIANELIEPPEFLPKLGSNLCQKQLGEMLGKLVRKTQTM